MTERAFFRELVLDKRRGRDADERDIAHAWHVANFTKASKLPDLQQVLKKRRMVTKTPTRTTGPSVRQQRANLAMLSEFLGKPLRKTRLRKRQPKT